MSANRADLRRLIRFGLQIFPDKTTINEGAPVSAAATSFTVTDVTYIAERMVLEIGAELLRVVSKAGSVVTVVRGYRGSTAAIHADGTVIQIHPHWGWADQELNYLIDDAVDFTKPEVWKIDSTDIDSIAGGIYEHTVSGTDYPNGIIIKKVEIYDDTRYVAVYGWEHRGDKIYFQHALDKTRNVRFTKQAYNVALTDDVTDLAIPLSREAVAKYATKLALEALLGNRTRYVEYSAALSDRASTPDELQRTIFYYFNQAVIAKERISRPPLAGFASTRRS